MKPLRFTITFIALSLASAAAAQPVLTQAGHGLASGFTDRVQAVSYVAPGAPGAGLSWDFRLLQPAGTPVVSSVTIDALGRFAVDEGGAATFYFEPSGDALRYTGFESPSKIVVYARAVDKLRFPFSFGRQFSEAYTAHGLFLSDTIASQLTGTYSVAADAYGSLVLPDGRAFEQALRIKTTDRYVEQVCGATETLIEKYLWYVPEYPFPVFTTVQAVSGYVGAALRDTVQVACYALVPDPEHPEAATPPAAENPGGQTSEKKEPVITLYPNPASTFIEVYSEVPVTQYQLRNMSGAIHQSQKVNPQAAPLRIPLFNTSPGWYVLSLETAEGWLVRRFVIQ